MGFDTDHLTQDMNSIGRFGIAINHFIPIVLYGNYFTWAKCRHHILHSSFNRDTIQGLERGFHNCLLSFLCTYVYDMVGFNLLTEIKVELRTYMNAVVPPYKPLATKHELVQKL
jgi:hypothetical protein